MIRIYGTHLDIREEENAPGKRWWTVYQNNMPIAEGDGDPIFDSKWARYDIYFVRRSTMLLIETKE